MAASLRQVIIGRLRRRLEQRGLPRLQMTLLVALTAGAGFLCSVALLHAGVTELWWRYLLSVGAGYLTFLILLWLWMRISAPSYIDPRDLLGLSNPEHSRDETWRERRRRDDDLPPEELFNFDCETGLPLLLLFLLLALLGSVLAACSYIISAAPLLFAELTLDGVLAATLYHRLRTLEGHYWLFTAVRRTFTTFLAAAVFVVAAGLVMAHYVPGARSIGEFMSRVL